LAEGRKDRKGKKNPLNAGGGGGMFNIG
jgi:hypothetical protein